MNKIAGMFGVLALAVYSIALINGLKVNWHSDSIPFGIYRRVDEIPVKGKLAASCLNYEITQHGLERGYFIKGECDTGIQPVVKPVTAVEGDAVSVTGEVISINGKEMSDYKIYQQDSKRRPLKRFYYDRYVLKKGEYWLMSDYKDNSYDSRYWGAVKVSYVVEPVVTVKAFKTTR